LPVTATDQKAEGYPRPELLLEVADLVKAGTAKQFRILDARPKAKYLADHIPDAVWVDHAAWSKAFATSQEAEGWAQRIGALGIDADSRVVVYDDSQTKDAARIWWILRYFGLRDVRLLNGGWPAWQVAGGKVTKDKPAVVKKTPKLTPQATRLSVKA